MIGSRWTLERVLGTGATATVYAARDATGAQAAVKILSEEMSARPDVRERFLREGQAADSVAHAGVVKVLEQDASDPSNTYLVMELLEGETLAERAQRLGSLPIDELLGIIDQVLDVLVAAHGQGVVHRDLKPGNLFLTDTGQVKLLDFGIARVIDPGAQAPATRLGVMLGTAAYMAPEQAQGKSAEVDGRTDLFALGALMFRLLSGRRVHECETDTLLLAAMATKPAPPVTTVAPELPASVCSIIDVALSFSKDARYPSAATMQTDVRAAREGHPPPFAWQAVDSREQATVLGGKSRPSDPQPPESNPEADEPDGEPSLEGQVIAERYRIEKLLGSGGMGSVYRGTHVHMRKAVAVKVLHREMTYLPEVVARFEREAVAAARIEHPHVAAATDFGRLEDGSFYLILEFVEGRSLGALLEATGPLEQKRALHIARQIVSALSAAHGASIVHRDLKPDNVMLVERKDDPDFVKVLDFGIAKLSAEDTAGQPALTQVGSVFGTPEYMSAEQAKGETVDARSDLYTVGILLYEMLSGKTPFAHDDMVAVLTAQMTQPPPPLPAHVDAAVSELVMTQLAKDPAARIQTADELLQRIDALLGPGYAATASPTPPAAQEQLGYSPTVLSVDQPGDTPASSPTLPAAQAAGIVRAAQSETTPSSVLDAITLRVPQLRKTVQIGGQTVPVWGLGAASLGLGLVGALLILVLLLATGGDEAPGQKEKGALAKAADLIVPSQQSKDDELAKRAAQGDRAALSELQAKPEKERSVKQWQSLGRGYAKIRDCRTSVASYEKALELDPSLVDDRQLLRDVRKALVVSASSEDAVSLCKSSLKTAGPDLLYDVWAKNKRNPSKKKYADAARKAIDSEQLRAKASPALLIALDLGAARGCGAYKKLLPRAAAYADGRSKTYLARLQARRGCGFLGLGDCYSCVRGDRNLTKALARVAKHPAPSFTAKKSKKKARKR